MEYTERTCGPSITRNLITRVLTICHVKLTQSAVMEQKRFDLRSLSPALHSFVFHSFGAIKEKARSPYVLRWQRGCTSSSLSDERNVLDSL